jgi:hypothetical protein
MRRKARMSVEHLKGRHRNQVSSGDRKVLRLIMSLFLERRTYMPSEVSHFAF